MRLSKTTRALLKQEVDRRRRIVVARHRRANQSLERFIDHRTKEGKRDEDPLVRS